jgi:DHA1 family bicyclomycin/chloramphenicol resistance-like MFS transporter
MNVVNRAMVPRFGSERMLRIGSVIALLSGTAAAVTASTDLGGLAGLVVPLLAYIAMLGLISANSLSGAMAAFPQRAGAASALAGSLQFCFGALGSAIVSSLANGTPAPMGWVIGGSSALTCASALLLRSRSPVPIEPRNAAASPASEPGKAASAP